MAEGIEMPEGHHGEELPFTIPVAVTMSILAVLVALATLFGHRAANEVLYLQTKAMDQWSYYQAKNMRQNEKQGVADMLGVLTPVDKEKADAMREQYKKDAERYKDEKGDIGEEAEKFEKERDVAERKENRFDASEVILEIGLIICSLTLLTKQRAFWYSGIALGFFGFAVMISGFLLK